MNDFDWRRWVGELSSVLESVAAFKAMEPA